MYQHQQIGVERFFQRGMERFHQLVGQFVDKAHRVHEQARAVFRQFHLAENRVERGEKLILHIGVRAGERVEQRGFARVGVAHQRHDGFALLFAARATHGPLTGKLLEFSSEVFDAAANDAAVQFQLGFAGAAHAQARARTHARKRRAQPGQARQAVFEHG